MKRVIFNEALDLFVGGKSVKLINSITDYDGKTVKSSMIKYGEHGAWKTINDYEYMRSEIIFNINAELNERSVNE